MLPVASLNYLSIAVSVIASFAIGFLWYSPLLFGKPWMKLMGIDPHDKNKMEKMRKTAGPAYAASIVGTVLMVYVMAHFVYYIFDYKALKTTDGMIMGFWIWLGFVAPVMFTDVLFGGKPMKLWLINTSYQLMTLLVSGAILATWV